MRSSGRGGSPQYRQWTACQCAAAHGRDRGPISVSSTRCPLAIARPQRYDKSGSIGKSLVTEASIWGPCESGSKHIQTPFNPLQSGRTSD